MNRRNFVKTGALATAALAAGVAQAQPAPPSAKPFQLRYAPHIGMFKHHAGDDPVAQLQFMADKGFTAFEDNGMKARSVKEQEAMAAVMAQRGIAMGVFVAHTIFWNEPNLASGNPDRRQQFLKEIEGSIAVAKRVNATWMTVVPGTIDPRLEMGYQTAHVVETLRRAADLLAPHGLVMVLEPLNFRDHPTLFLTKAAQAYLICKAVNSPACKILFDIYHQQITEGNLIPNIDLSWDEIAYFQIGDNPGRNEPSTGEINYQNIFKHLKSRGFDGILGMEHGNAGQGKAGEEALLKAYREADNF